MEEKCELPLRFPTGDVAHSSEVKEASLSLKRPVSQAGEEDHIHTLEDCDDATTCGDEQKCVRAIYASGYWKPNRTNETEIKVKNEKSERKTEKRKFGSGQK